VQLGGVPLRSGESDAFPPHLLCYLLRHTRCVKGGYFVLRGSEKVLVAQENMAKNQVCILVFSVLHTISLSLAPLQRCTAYLRSSRS